MRKIRSYKRLKGITVLSLFDGMSCGQIALNRIGLNVENYYASEIDKYAIQVTQHNYPNTIQIGSVLDITIERLGKFEILLNGKYIINTRKLILIGGSPCQGFSFAGTMAGSSTECNIDVTTLEQYLDFKSKNFKFKGQSYLFWEYMRVLREVTPMYYFLENVKMVKKWEGMFNDAIGHEPVVINSALVSAQNRVRLYWTNIPDVTQPEDIGIYIKDILEADVDEKYYMSPKATFRSLINPRSRVFTSDKKKTGTLLANQAKQSTDVLYYIADTDIMALDILKRSYSIEGNKKTKVLVGALRGRYLVDGKRQAHKMKTAGLTTQMLEIREDEKSNCLTTVQKDNVVVEYTKKQLRLNRYYKRNKILIIPEATKKGYIEVRDGECFDYTQPNSKTRRGRAMLRKSNCLTTSHQLMRYEHPRVRKVTPVECERLQTVMDNYTAVVSNSQRYKMLGNGWTIDVPAHVFEGLKPRVSKLIRVKKVVTAFIDYKYETTI